VRHFTEAGQKQMNALANGNGHFHLTLLSEVPA